VIKCGQTDEYTKDSSCLHTIYSLSKMAVIRGTDKVCGTGCGNTSGWLQGSTQEQQEAV